MLADQIPILDLLDFPSRPPLRYFGGKWRLAKWLLSYFPKHQNYCTPYGGGWCESFQKIRPSGIEVYNDLNAHNVNFMRQLQQNPEALISAIQATPRTREVFELCRTPSDDLIEWAKRYYLYCQMSVMGGGGPLWSGTSDARLALAAIRDDRHLWAASRRLIGVRIEQLDAIECIAKYDSPKSLFYCDPGYPKESLASASREWYLHHTNTDGHIALAAALKSCQGAAVVSGYDCSLYRDLFEGWTRLEHPALTMNRSKAVECLWIKP